MSCSSQIVAEPNETVGHLGVAEAQLWKRTAVKLPELLVVKIPTDTQNLGPPPSPFSVMPSLMAAAVEFS